MIKDEIERTKSKLSNLKENYKNLVKDIKDIFYDKVDCWADDSPRKPRGETAMMQAALSLVEGRSPRYSFYLNVRQAKDWGKDKKDVWLDYWVINQDRFKDRNGTPATIVIRKKNIKLLEEICKELWVKEVSASYRPNTTLGFKEWLEVTNVDKILELMQENLNEHKDNRVYLVTDRNLYLKDIVVIFPKKPVIFGIL